MVVVHEVESLPELLPIFCELVMLETGDELPELIIGVLLNPRKMVPLLVGATLEL